MRAVTMLWSRWYEAAGGCAVGGGDGVGAVAVHLSG